MNWSYSQHNHITLKTSVPSIACSLHLLYRTFWIVFFLLLGVSRALGGDQLVLSDKPVWTFSGIAEGKRREFHLPADISEIKRLPESDRKILNDQIKLIERNQAETRRAGKSFFSQNSPYRLTPDYDRNLSEIAISISYADASSKNPLERHLPLLRALPSYSKIHVISPAESIAATQRMLSTEGLKKRSVVHQADGWNSTKQLFNSRTRPTRWVRDTFMVGADAANKTAVFMPMAYNNIDDLASSDLHFLKEKWHDSDSIVNLPIFVRGGNVAVSDDSSGKRLLFFGADEITRNEMYFRRSVGLAPPSELLQTVLKKAARAEQAIILPNSESFFHIDMAMSFLAPGIVALADPVDEGLLPPSDESVLLSLRKALPRLGFRVISIPTTAARIKATQSPVNIVPYVDKNSGKRRALVPKFKDSEVTIKGRKQSLNQAIQQAYEAAGIEVVWIDDRFSDRGGNIHCTLIGLR